MPVEKVHLHEVGALDSIIDIVGAVHALEWFGADRIVSSALNVGGGTVKSAHGIIPVPAPATVKLLGDAPIYSGDVQKELVTPTGALIVSSYATSFGSVPAMNVEHVGYGAGDNDFPSTPNVLRVLIGRESAAASATRVVVIECEIDDMNPQIFGVVMDRLYAAGRARSVLRPRADEEEPSRHAADGGRRARRCGRRCPRSSSARRRRSACAIPRSSATAWCASM